MKMMLFALAVSTSMAAAQSSSIAKNACGPAGERISDSEPKSNQKGTSPEPGKAVLYFIEDDGLSGNHQHYTIKIGMDGKWAGKYKGNSYFAVPVDPGEHHLCANVQSASSVGTIVALAHIKAMPGESYYFRTRFLAGINSMYALPPYLSFEPVDSDEGIYLIETIAQHNPNSQ